MEPGLPQRHHPGTKHDLHLLGWTGDYDDAYNFIGTFFDRQKDEWGFTNPALFAEFKDGRRDRRPGGHACEKYKELNKADHGVPAGRADLALAAGARVRQGRDRRSRRAR